MNQQTPAHPPHQNSAEPAKPTGMVPISIDAFRWPDVAAIPTGRIRAIIARRLFKVIAARTPLYVILPSGDCFGDPDAPVMYLHRPDSFYRRIGGAGLIGFGEAYMAGDWDAENLASLMTELARQIDRLVPPKLQWLRHLYVKHQPTEDDASLKGARRNVQRHYDLSNELFALFLDETMTYSSALFETDMSGDLVIDSSTPDAAAACLARAQRRKFDRLLDLVEVAPGSRVLEIGSGWGELAIRAAGRGAEVVAITLSREQCKLARERVAAVGLADNVSIRLLDYREITGKFDAILSVEMIEAVGERYWPRYFSTLDSLLTPGGRIGLQAITMPHERMLASRRTQTWFLKYIFPGGLLPSMTAIKQHIAEQTSLTIVDQLDFGAHYAETLRIWRERFSEASLAAPTEYDDVFKRMWQLYLAHSEAGFRSRYLQVSQLLLRK
jgi:cyclopropane-fatty-acyl-phospholipid synthase